MHKDRDINSNKEQWIDKVMAGTQGIQRALPPDDLYEQIIKKLNSPAKTKVMPLSAIKWAAAAVLLLAINLGSVLYASSLSFASKQNKTTTNPIAAEILSEATYNY